MKKIRKIVSLIYPEYEFFRIVNKQNSTIIEFPPIRKIVVNLELGVKFYALFLFISEFDFITIWIYDMKQKGLKLSKRWVK